MSLTPSQLTTLRAAIDAETDADLISYRTNGQTPLIAAWYNTPASPTFYVWRKQYTSAQIAAAIDAGITQLDALTASKRDSLLWWAGRDHDASVAQTRTAIDDLTGSQNTLKAALMDGAKRAATRGEKLFATGTGSLASPATTVVDGMISDADISAALSL
jgi:hypothetical protein